MTGRKKEESSSWVKQFLVNLLLGANLVTLVLLWTCCVTTWLDPSLHPRISVIGLAFPIFLILNLLYLPIWLIFKPRMLVVPVFGIILCADYILDYYPISMRGKSDDVPALTVMTWNCHEMQYYQHDSIHFATDYILETGADIICLQEYTFASERYKKLHDELMTRGYQLNHVGCISVMSRFPVLNDVAVPIEVVLGTGAMQVDLQMPDNDTLSVICVHLESNKLSSDDKDEYDAAIRSGEHEKMKDEAHYLAGKLAVAAQIRANQINLLAKRVDSIATHHPVLMCGDFNDTPISYAYQHISRRLKNAYRSRGCGVGVTFNEKNFPVRIDHVFYTSDLTCTDVMIDHTIWASDHYPVIARLKKRQK